jgi:hypothetical protein
LALLALAGCADAPMPGGEDTVNATYYTAADDFKARVDQLQPGMGESQVLSILGRTRNDMTRLGREQIVSALYGGSAVQMLDNAAERDQTRLFLNSLYGYRLEYKNVIKHHGFASPIRLRTIEQGYSYTVNLIFQNGVLLERPVLAGGIINDTQSRTLFDYINPGTFLSHAG